MKNLYRVVIASFLIIAFLLPAISVVHVQNTYDDNFLPNVEDSFNDSDVPTTPIPVNRMTFVSHDPESYMDDFSYMASIPSSIFYDGDTKYISPLIYSGFSDPERWFLEDWADYASNDGGISEVITVGDLTPTEVMEIQGLTGSKAYPQITGGTSAEIAAKIAVNDWRYANTVVLALAKDYFPSPTITSDSATYTFNGAELSSYETTTTISTTTNKEISFTPPAGVGWMEGSFNWTGDEIFTHVLEDPNGRVVDYSVYGQVALERSPSRVDSPLPLFFWYPYTSSGEWTFIMDPRSQISRDIVIDCSVTYYPGFSESITVPSNAKWLNISTMWDNAGTTLDIALVDPDGRLVMWSPAESLLGGSGSKTLDMPYPAPGEWTLVGAWVDPSAETNNVNIDWDIETLPSDLQSHLESAGNGAVLASLLNAPLLYVNTDTIPEVTSWALEYLGATSCFLVDPANIHTSNLVDALDDTLFVSSLSSYGAVANWIHTLSGEKDIVLTVPLGNNDELFAPAAYSAASHGATIFSMCGEDNQLTTRAEETWYPYMIGPEIRIFVQRDYSVRAENGWYDERIPNIYSMRFSAATIESFLLARGSYNESASQSIVLVSPTDLIKVSFDRSLQSRFACGRIPAKGSGLAAVMINKAALHRFLFRTSENADKAFLSLYAYTLDYPYSDNFGTSYNIRQIEDSEAAFTAADFTISAHVGADEVFATVNSQVAVWSLSTHGTLTEYPTDPPQRPDGLGVFSMRDVDIPYGQETDSSRDANQDSIVNPVAFNPEVNNHVLRTTSDLENAIDNIGSPIVIITACLLGGSEMPTMLMEHGAVAVTAAPRTVYFQPAGLLSILISEGLSSGQTTGDSLANALSAISHDYTDPITMEPRDYANQQVLFGDPDICLYNPQNDARIPLAEADSVTIDGHMPGRGVKDVVGVGVSNYLQVGLDSISVEYDFYGSNNYSDFLRLLDLRTTVIIEPQTIDDLESVFVEDPTVLPDFVKSGGTLIIIGVNDDVSWLPWDLEYISGTSSSSVTLDSSHPLLSTPNTISDSMNSEGYFATVSANLSILASDLNGIVIAAGLYGTGKVAVTTNNPTGTARDDFLENAVAWNEQDSLVLWDISMNQEIIWTGDRVSITFKVSDIGGSGLSDVDVSVIVNSTQFSVVEESGGRYTILVDEAWTSANPGVHSIRLNATKDGYDSLSVLLEGYLFIRSSPLLIIVFAGGAIIGVAVVWQYRKRKYRDSSPRVKKFAPRETKEERKRRELAEKERKRKREEEEKRVDTKEFFGVD